MDRRGRLLQPPGIGRAVADQLRAAAAHPVGKLIQRFQQGRLLPPVFQYSGLVLQKAVELAEDFLILRPDLPDGVVQQPSAHGSAFLDQVQVVRAEQHQVQRLRQFTGCFSDAVYQDFLRCSRFECHLHGLLPTVAVDIRQQLRRGILKVHQLLVKPRSEASSAAQQVNRFQQIRLPLRVVSGNHIGSFMKIDGLPFVVPEPRDRKPFNIHSSL